MLNLIHFQTPVLIVAQHGHVYVVEDLVRYGADLDLQQNEGATPVYLATYFSQREVVETLVNLGADVHIKDRMKLTPLDIARQTLNWQLSHFLEKVAKSTTFV